MKPAWGVCFLTLLSLLEVASAAEPTVRFPPAPREADQQAQRCFLRGDYASAAGIYEKILAAAPHDFKTLSSLGVMRFRLDQLAGAADVLEQAAKLAPGDVFVRYTLGIVYYRQARYEEAGEALRKAAELAPQDASVHRYLAFVYARQGRADLVKNEWGKIYEIELPAAASTP